MHSKRRYKICICSVILGELESFRNYKGFSIIFPKILGFLFPTKNSLTWGVKCENQTSENRREFIKPIKLASKFVREWKGHLEIFSLLQVIENSRQYLLLRADILQKTVVGCTC